MEKELSINEHNAKVLAKIAKLEAEIKELYASCKSEADKPQASLHQCNQLAKKHKT